MDPEQAEHVFERFYRSDPSRSRLHGGAGLGLSIVSAIVAAHGGTVAAEQRRGRGDHLHRPPPDRPAADQPTAGTAGRGRCAGGRRGRTAGQNGVGRTTGPTSSRRRRRQRARRSQLTGGTHRVRVRPASVPRAMTTSSHSPVDPSATTPRRRQTWRSSSRSTTRPGSWRPASPPCAPSSTPRSPSSPRSPSPTTPAPTTPGRSPPAWPPALAGVRRHPPRPRRAGAGPCGRRGRASTGAGRRLHGRRPRHRARRPAPPGRPPALRAQRRRHRYPAGGRRPRGPRGPSARSSPGPTTSCSAPRSATPAPTPSAASRPCARDAAAELLPLVEDNDWFFDTEVLVTAQRIGLRIHEVPVDWVDDPDSRVARGSAPPGATSAGCGACSVLPPGASAPAARPSDRPGPGSSRATTALPARLPSPVAARLCGRRHGPPDGAASGGRRRGLRRRAPPLRRGRCGQHRWPTSPCSPLLEPDARQLRRQRRGHRPVQPGQHRRPPGHGGDRPSRPRPAPPHASPPPPCSGSAWPSPPVRWPPPGRLGMDVSLPSWWRSTLANLGAAVIRFAILRTWVFRPQFGTHLLAGGPGRRRPKPATGPTAARPIA